MDLMNYTYKKNGLFFFKEHLILGRHNKAIYSLPIFRVWEDGFIQNIEAKVGR